MALETENAMLYLKLAQVNTVQIERTVHYVGGSHMEYT